MCVVIILNPTHLKLKLTREEREEKIPVYSLSLYEIINKLIVQDTVNS
jgi:hypothetical protein